MCICKTPHMTATCEDCAPGYTYTDVEEELF